MKPDRNTWILLGLMTLFTALRWPELLPSNFSPVYAICLCSGIYLTGARAWVLPVVLMLFSDLIINQFVYRPLGYSVFGGYLLLNYVLLLTLIGLGRKLTARANPATLIVSGMLGGIAFFAIANAVSWYTDPGYPKTLAGLMQAFTVGKLGFPPTWLFFRNAAISGALFTGMIVFAIKYYGA
ncbi:uncharacterized protein METZ01_LOCUS208102, partial [marine metagenome]